MNQKSTRFAVISDTHFYAPGAISGNATCWNQVLRPRSMEIGACLVDTINELGAEFVIHCGDLTGFCDLENWEAGCQVLDQLDCPWYAVLGNHDTWFPGVRDAFSARFGLPPGQCNYSRDLAGMRFLFLDLAHWRDRQGGVSPYLDKEAYDAGQIAGLSAGAEGTRWLEKELASTSDRPVVLVSHPPLGFKAGYPLGTLPKGKPAPGDLVPVESIMSDVMEREALRDLIRQSPDVRMAFAGHWHIHDATYEDGVCYCQTASLREYPFEVRVVDVEPGKLRVSTAPLKDAGFQKASYVPAWNNDWVRGSHADRTFAVEILGLAATRSCR